MKTLQKNFTTPEQSKRLLELGVPADSADFYYEERASLSGKWEYKLHIGECVAIKHNLFSYRNGYVVPCWSVGRLMEIIRICNLTAEKPWVYIEQDNIHAMITAITDGVNNRMLDFSKLKE